LVFQPVNTADVFVNEPVLPTTLTVSPEVYGVEPSDGAVPPVLPLPLYAIVGWQVPDRPCRVRNGYPDAAPEQIDHTVPVLTPLPELMPSVMLQFRLSEL
jgi:hypothetical protein